MLPIEATGIRELLDGGIAAASMLGGAMAYLSGYKAARALADGQPPRVVTEQINEGIGIGFHWGAQFGLMGFIIVVWT